MKKIKLIFLGDIVGRSGRDALFEHLPYLKTTLKPDLIIVNGENAAGGFGINETICLELFERGVHVITSGNHIWDQKETKSLINKQRFLLRPLNFPKGTPGSGIAEFDLSNGQKFIVLNAMGQLFMDALDNPFNMLANELRKYPLSSPTIAGIFIDFHAEATSEKMALARFLDGQVSCIVGTHTHVPTADAQISALGTAYMTDAGMCGAYGDTVIGMKKEEPIQRFNKKIREGRLEAGEGVGTISGIYLEIDASSGKSLRIDPIILGPHLKNQFPTF